MMDLNLHNSIPFSRHDNIFKIFLSFCKQLKISIFSIYVDGIVRKLKNNRGVLKILNHYKLKCW